MSGFDRPVRCRARTFCRPACRNRHDRSDRSSIAAKLDLQPSSELSEPLSHSNHSDAQPGDVMIDIRQDSGRRSVTLILDLQYNFPSFESGGPSQLGYPSGV